MASRMVTSAPRRFHTLPSSRPITPAPITARRFGVSLKSSAPTLSTMYSPSNFANGSSIESEPAAMITLVPLSSTSPPSCCFTFTTRSAWRVAKP